MALPRPGHKPAPKSLENLKPGQPSPGRPKKTPRIKKAEEHALRVLEDPAYRRNLYARARAGKLQPGMEVALWQYAYGKAVDKVETNQGPAIVQIIHKLRGERDDPEPEGK